MIRRLDGLGWAPDRLPEALEGLGRRHGWDVRPVPPPEAPIDPDKMSVVELERWVESTAAGLGVQAEPVELPYEEVDGFLRAGAPAVVRIGGEAGPFWLVILRGGRRRLEILGPDLAIHDVERSVVRDALCAGLERPIDDEVAVVLDAVELPARRREQARVGLLRHTLAGSKIGGCWIVRPPPDSGLVSQLGGRRLLRRVAGVLGAHLAQYALWLGSWWLIGWIILGDRLTGDWLMVWLLLLATLIPFRLLAAGTSIGLSIDAGARLRQRLLAGALKMDPDEIRHMGVGQLMGRAMDVEVAESFGLAGGILVLTAAIELAAATAILAVGAGGPLHALLLLAWTGGVAWLGLRYYRERSRWTESRLELTHDLVEELVGHRTRLAQQPPARWHERDDQLLERYHRPSLHLDRLRVMAETVAPRGWFLVGLAGLVPVFVRDAYTAGAMAVSLGGILLAFRAFRGAAIGVEHLAGARIAWERIAPFARAADREDGRGRPELTQTATPAGNGRRHLLDARGLWFRHAGRPEPVLADVDLRIHTRDRVILEGPSGEGKSTLASVLAACRAPESGILLLEGIDLPTLGAGRWRRRVVFVPQFHENHLLLGSLAYNVLLGRHWPATEDDVAEAEAVCRSLGLGPLLDRMPGGMSQVVGETGWQLSHGEKTRVFVARALVQRPDLLILDESFAALDPETVRRAIAYLLEQDAALVVIAHP